MPNNLEQKIRDAAARVADEVMAATEGGDRNPDEALGDWPPFRQVIEALRDIGTPTEHRTARQLNGETCRCDVCIAKRALDAITGAKETKPLP